MPLRAMRGATRSLRLLRLAGQADTYIRTDKRWRDLTMAFDLGSRQIISSLI